MFLDSDKTRYKIYDTCICLSFIVSGQIQKLIVYPTYLQHVWVNLATEF